MFPRTVSFQGQYILSGSPRFSPIFNRSKNLTNIIADGGPAGVHPEPDSRVYNRSPPFHDSPLRRPLSAELTLAQLLPIGKSSRGRRRDRSGFSSRRDWFVDQQRPLPERLVNGRIVQ
jgi:hypothetical protein